MTSGLQEPCPLAAVSRARLCGPTGSSLLSGCLIYPQAKYLAQIIVMGVQVVGRAFARALRQEFAGKHGSVSPLGWEFLSRSDFPHSHGHLRPAGSAVWVAWGTSHGGGWCQTRASFSGDLVINSIQGRSWHTGPSRYLVL